MFRKAKNIDTAFRQMRLVALATVVASLLLCCFISYTSLGVVRSAQGKVYVLANKMALEAYASDRKDNLLVEAKSHIATFHRYFFTLSPDDRQINETISRALYLADNSAKRQYDNLRERNYYVGVVSGNINQSIHVDSISVDLGAAPFRFLVFARQEITRPTSLVVRNLVTEGFLREVPRSGNNPHGFLIEKWKILENKDLSIKNR